MDLSSKIYIAGHAGLAGSAVWRAFERAGYQNLIGKRSRELDLTNQQQVEDFFAAQKPEVVVLAAARVGGMFANKAHPAEFIGINLKIQTNVIDAAYRHGVKKFCFLGTSCVYPLSNELLTEEILLSAPLEKSNEAYAVAKIAGIKMCQFYHQQYGWDAFSVMPPNLYGVNDDFSTDNSHVLAGMMRRMDEAKTRGDPRFVIWGTGTPRREFLWADDLGEAIVFLLTQPTTQHRLINIGPGSDISIRELAQKIAQCLEYKGELVQDTTKPDGHPRKTMDVAKLFALGWKPTVALDDGIERLWQWYQTHRVELLKKGKI